MIFRSEESQKDNKKLVYGVSETSKLYYIQQPRNKSKSWFTFEYKMNTKFETNKIKRHNYVKSSS